MPGYEEPAGVVSALVPTFEAAPAARLLRERLAEVRPVVRERLAVARLAGFFAALRDVERLVDFFAADFVAEERERLVDFFAAVDFLAAVDFFAADFFAAPPRPVDFFAAPPRAVEREADFLPVDRDEDDRFAADLPRPADFALDLAVAFLVPEDFEDLPPDLPLDAFLPAAAMSRSFLAMEMMH